MTTQVGWIYAAVLVMGYFYVVTPTFFPHRVSATRIVRDLNYEDVKKSHLLVLSKSAKEGVTSENALLLVQFKTNNWRLVHAGRRESPTTLSKWSVRIVHDTPAHGIQDHPHLPTESDVEEFLTDENWFFEPTNSGSFLGEVYTNTWNKALGYIPRHTWTAPTARSPETYRAITLINEFIAARDAETQMRAIAEFASLPKIKRSRRFIIPRPRFYAMGDDYMEFSWHQVELNRVNAVLVYDQSGGPASFDPAVVKVESPAVLEAIRDWMVDKQSLWGAD